MDACNAGLPCSIFQTNVKILAMRSIFRVPKMLLFAIYDEVIQYQMESKNMYSVDSKRSNGHLKAYRIVCKQILPVVA